MKNFKICTLLCFLSFTLSNVQGQTRFSHSLGASYYSSNKTSSAGIMYSPRVNLLNLNHKMTLSAGTHLGLGFALGFDGTNTSTMFNYDLPLVAEVNFGHGANRESSARFGGFVGGGYGFNRMRSAPESPSGYQESQGFLINGGLRFKLKNTSLGVRASYLLNNKSGGQNIASLGVFYNFGK